MPPTPIINPTTFPAARFFNISTLLNAVLPILTIGSLFGCGAMLFYGAFVIMTGAGDAEKITQARAIVTWAIVGLVLVVSAFLIVRIIGSITNVTIPI